MTKRLADAKFKRIKEYYSAMGGLDPDIQEDMRWLINRIEELERENEKVKGGNFGLSKIINSKRKEIKRYKQALEFYADEENYKENLITKAEYDADGICISNDEYAPPIIYFDRGEKARQALESDNE